MNSSNKITELAKVALYEVFFNYWIESWSPGGSYCTRIKRFECIKPTRILFEANRITKFNIYYLDSIRILSRDPTSLLPALSLFIRIWQIARCWLSSLCITFSLLVMEATLFFDDNEEGRGIVISKKQPSIATFTWYSSVIVAIILRIIHTFSERVPCE